MNMDDDDDELEGNPEIENEIELVEVQPVP